MMRLPTKNGWEKQKKNPKSQSFQGFLGVVRMTGFPPVAALADKQSTGLFGPSDKLLRNFLPISNPYPYKTKKDVPRGHVLFLRVIDE